MRRSFLTFSLSFLLLFAFTPIAGNAQSTLDLEVGANLKKALTLESGAKQIGVGGEVQASLDGLPIAVSLRSERHSLSGLSTTERDISSSFKLWRFGAVALFTPYSVQFGEQIAVSPYMGGGVIRAKELSIHSLSSGGLYFERNTNMAPAIVGGVNVKFSPLVAFVEGEYDGNTRFVNYVGEQQSSATGGLPINVSGGVRFALF